MDSWIIKTSNGFPLFFLLWNSHSELELCVFQLRYQHTAQVRIFPWWLHWQTLSSQCLGNLLVSWWWVSNAWMILRVTVPKSWSCELPVHQMRKPLRSATPCYFPMLSCSKAWKFSGAHHRQVALKSPAMATCGAVPWVFYRERTCANTEVVGFGSGQIWVLTASVLKCCKITVKPASWLKSFF